MKNILIAFVFLLLVNLAKTQEIKNPNSIIVNFKNKFPTDKEQNLIDRISQNNAATGIKKLNFGKKNPQHSILISFQEDVNIFPIVEELKNSELVEFAEPDYWGSGAGVEMTVPNDQYFTRQWGLKNDGSFTLSTSVSGADIEMENAWNIEQGDSNIIVCIIDSGVKLNHPDFGGRIWNNSAEISANGIDDDNNGFIDDKMGWDFINNDNNPNDDHGHGSNVAGIVGLKANNSLGYAGVDWHCKLMILKGLNSSNSGSYAAWADAIYYAVDNGANVINMSMGGSSNSTALQNAINYALNNNVCVVACMMNYNSSTTYYPAGYNGVIAVGSTNPNDERTEPFFWSSTSGSNFGNHISVVAPGNYIYGINYNDDTYYGSYWGGTSQAAPHVAGLASLLLAQNPTLSPSQIKNIIETSAEDQVGLSSEDIAGWDQYYGHGRINAFRALSQFSSSINTENNQISIVPNPFTNSCRINFDNFENDISVLVVNSIGQTLISMHNLSGHNINLDRNSLEAGIYFISVTKSGKLIITKAIEIRD